MLNLRKKATTYSAQLLFQMTQGLDNVSSNYTIDGAEAVVNFQGEGTEPQQYHIRITPMEDIKSRQEAAGERGDYSWGPEGPPPGIVNAVRLSMKKKSGGSTQFPDYPIVQIKTEDGLILHGLLSESKNADKIVIHFHGTAGHFYDEDFIKNMFIEYPQMGFSLLSTNNRGSSVLGDSWQNTGSAVENFKDCLIDINGWIEYCLDRGYKEIILQGHSLGTEKLVYYMNKGQYRSKISKLILIGFSDSYGNAHKFMGDSQKQFFREARQLIQEGKKEQLLTIDYKSHAGLLPISAGAFMDHYSEDSELSKSLSFWKKELDYYSRIQVPILAIISDNDLHTMDKVVINGSEHVMMGIEESVDLIKKENLNTTAIIIKDTNHDFEGKETKLTRHICSFLANKLNMAKKALEIGGETFPDALKFKEETTSPLDVETDVQKLYKDAESFVINYIWSGLAAEGIVSPDDANVIQTDVDKVQFSSTSSLVNQLMEDGWFAYLKLSYDTKLRTDSQLQQQIFDTIQNAIIEGVV